MTKQNKVLLAVAVVAGLAALWWYRQRAAAAAAADSGSTGTPAAKPAALIPAYAAGGNQDDKPPKDSPADVTADAAPVPREYYGGYRVSDLDAAFEPTWKDYLAKFIARFGTEPNEAQENAQRKAFLKKYAAADVAKKKAEEIAAKKKAAEDAAAHKAQVKSDYARMTNQILTLPGSAA